jgi:hypothetical protein
VRATGARGIEEGAMTTIETRRDPARPMMQPARDRGMARTVLLACGILASLLYVATDLLGGLRYDGYSFTSQAISELMAVGAPSEAFVDPRFITYGVLALAFAVGVFREAAGRNRPLRITAVLLMAYAAVGFTGPTLFEMHQPGAGSAGSDTPHIVLTGVLVLLTLLAIGFGAFAFGKRFRIYSFATLLILIVLGTLSAPYGARLAAGQPTPGFGIIERILIYSSLLWMTVLAIALLRRPWARGTTTARVTATTPVDGMVAPGFEEVRAEFERNFAERGDIGAAVAAFWHGEKVVDLWGGRRARATATTPWRSGSTCRSSSAASIRRIARSGASSTTRSPCRSTWSSISGFRRRFLTTASPCSRRCPGRVPCWRCAARRPR